MDYKYPIYKYHTPSKEIIKFTSLNSGTTVKSGNSSHEVGYTTDFFVEHTIDEFRDTDFREKSIFNYYI